MILEMAETKPVKRGLSAIFAKYPKFWLRSNTGHNNDPVISHRRKIVKELCIFAGFMLTFNIAIFGASSVSRYYLTSMFTNLLINQKFGDQEKIFANIATIDEVWLYLEEIALPFIYLDYYRFEHESNQDEKMRQTVFKDTLLGVPRLRQIRVTNNSCDIPSVFSDIIRECFSPYSLQSEDNTPFGPAVGTAWIYHSEEALGGLRFGGQVATYGGGGNYVDVGTKYKEAKRTVTNLKNLDWIQRGSRLVVLDFSTYNLNVNLLTFIKIAFELPATGGVIPSCSINCTTFLRYLTSWDIFVMVCEILFCLFTVYYTAEEIKEIKEDWRKYGKQAWNYVDLIMLIISMFCIVFTIYRTWLVQTIFQNLFMYSGKFFNFETLAYWNTVYSLMAAILSFLCWIKIFKYISFNLTMVQLSTTLSRCWKDVTGFTIMFFIIFMAYAELGFLLFGDHLEDYKLLHHSMFTLLRAVIGDFEFQALQQVNRTVGPIFFLTYVFFVFFVLLNMFLAIINDTYMAVKTELKMKYPHGNVFTSALKVGAVAMNTDVQTQGIFQHMKTQNYRRTAIHRRVFPINRCSRLRNLWRTRIQTFLSYHVKSLKI